MKKWRKNKFSNMSNTTTPKKKLERINIQIYIAQPPIIMMVMI